MGQALSVVSCRRGSHSVSLVMLFVRFLRFGERIQLQDSRCARSMTYFLGHIMFVTSLSGHQRKQFLTYIVPSKFHVHSLNAPEVTNGGYFVSYSPLPPPPVPSAHPRPGSGSQKFPGWIGLRKNYKLLREEITSPLTERTNCLSSVVVVNKSDMRLMTHKIWWSTHLTAH